MERDGVARPLEMEQQNLETSHLLVCLVFFLLGFLIVVNFLEFSVDCFSLGFRIRVQG